MCPNCGAMLVFSGNMMFCGECGYTISTTPLNETSRVIPNPFAYDEDEDDDNDDDQ